MTHTHVWTELAWTDFETLDMERMIAILPLAAVEQHGPHLPLGVDTFIMEGYLERVLERLPPGAPVPFDVVAAQVLDELGFQAIHGMLVVKINNRAPIGVSLKPGLKRRTRGDLRRVFQPAEEIEEAGVFACMGQGRVGLFQLLQFCADRPHIVRHAGRMNNRQG